MALKNFGDIAIGVINKDYGFSSDYSNWVPIFAYMEGDELFGTLVKPSVLDHGTP